MDEKDLNENVQPDEVVAENSSNENVEIKEEIAENTSKEENVQEEEKHNENVPKEKALKKVNKEKKFKLGVPKDKIIMISVVIITLALAFGLFGWYYYNNVLKPVATFDGGELNTADYTIYYKTFAPMLEYYGYAADSIPQQIANKAAIDKILLLKAKQAGVTLSDADKKTVDDEFNDKTQVQTFIDEGIDPTKMKQLYYNDYIINGYISKMKKDLSNDEVTQYLKTTYGDSVDMTEYVTRQILFSTVDQSTGQAMTADQKAQVKAKAEAALKRALAGEDFAALAKELSEDSGTKDNGGLYNMYMDENTVQEYKTAVLKLKAGEITTALVESSYGYHIIKLENIVAGGRVNSDADRTQIVNGKIDQMGTDMHLSIKNDVLTKLVESITGKKATDANNTTNNTTTNTTTTNTTDTTNTTNTTTNTAQ